MTLKEVLEKMDNFTDEERAKYLGGLFKILSPVSTATLSNFQNRWEPEGKTFKQFVVEQNKEIKKCIELEVSVIGEIVRKESGLELITLETVIGE